MRDLVLAACRSDPSIRDRAIKLATGFGYQGPVEAVQGFEWDAREHFVFIDEPEELLTDPVVMFMQLERDGRIFGDCDDAAMYIACLTYSIGLRTRFKACISAPDGSYQHVFTEYMIPNPDRWVPIDPTICGIPVYECGDWIAEEL